MTSRNALALLLTAISIGLLIPGLTQPVLTIVATMNMLGVTQEVFRQTQSVLEAVRTLHNSDNDFVAGLILFFSVTVPFLKALALVIILTLRDPAKRYRLYLMVRSLSKWAMADVFAVGIMSSLLFFFYSREPRGAFGVVSRVGIGFLMVGFGAGYGYTVMSRVSLLIGRFQFLLGDWLGLR